jgi:sporulation protein YlmC with PRC-barrel domain
VDELRGDAVLQLPVRTNGIELGRPTDLIVDLAGGRAVGVDVFCGDRRRRFLPLAAARIEEDRIAVTSALILLDDLGADFYRRRAEALRDLRGRQVERDGRRVGRLVDVVLGSNAALRALLVEDGRGELVVPLEDGPVIAPV